MPTQLTIEQLLSVIATLPDPLFVLTESGRYAAVCGGGDQRFYHDGSGLIGLSIYEVIPTEKADWIMAQIATALREQRLCTVEYGLAGSDVEGLDTDNGPSGQIWFEGRIQPLPFQIDGERAVVWSARNITERHRLENELRRLSEFDELTGAVSRRRLMSELADSYNKFRRYEKNTALLMFDTDHFKNINDFFGHSVGDRVLHSTAQLCISRLRGVDIFARFGGEEFVALLPHTSLEEASQTAERLRSAIAENSVAYEGGEVTITVSIGISVIGENDTSYEEVLKRADDALYEAKNLGRNRVVAIAPNESSITQQRG